MPSSSSFIPEERGDAEVAVRSSERSDVILSSLEATDASSD
jgi:hypothetical protein